jgi:hypothetical protein
MPRLVRIKRPCKIITTAGLCTDPPQLQRSPRVRASVVASSDRAESPTSAGALGQRPIKASTLTARRPAVNDEGMVRAAPRDASASVAWLSRWGVPAPRCGQNDRATNAGWRRWPGRVAVRIGTRDRTWGVACDQPMPMIFSGSMTKIRAPGRGPVPGVRRAEIPLGERLDVVGRAVGGHFEHAAAHLKGARRARVCVEIAATSLRVIWSDRCPVL